METTLLVPEVQPTPQAASVISHAALDWKAIEQGIPLAGLEDFAVSSGFAMKDLLDVIIPPRTLKHRRERKEPLNLEESDRLARVARLWKLAVSVFGNPDKARRWLTKPKVCFEERTPLSMMKMEIGGRMVEEMLIQIQEGMFA